MHAEGCLGIIHCCCYPITTSSVVVKELIVMMMMFSMSTSISASFPSIISMTTVVAAIFGIATVAQCSILICAAVIVCLFLLLVTVAGSVVKDLGLADAV